MRQIVEGFGTPPHTVPTIDLLNNYFVNNVFFVELMLKLLSGNWKSHDVGSMYHSVFEKPHQSPQLMKNIKEAIINQKYLFEPALGLSDSVPELEALHDEVRARIKQKFPDFSVKATVSLPNNFTKYIQDHADRFCRLQSPTFGPHNPPPSDFWEKHIAESHGQLQQVRQAFKSHGEKQKTFDFMTHIESLT